VAIDRRNFLAQQIGQLESGGNPGIGYHNRSRSTAYGQFGITGATWAGLRRTNPSLPADITQSTPEQQRAAFDQLSAANGQQLVRYGLPANTGNLALAHLLGAPDARDYIQKGTLSAAASEANGGEDALRRRADQMRAMLAPGEMPEQFVRELPAVASGPEMASGTAMAQGEMPEQYVRELPAVASGPEMASGTAMAPGINTDGDPGGPAGHGSGPAPEAAEKGADWAGALKSFGKSLSKMGRDSVGPDAASLVKPRTFAEPEAGEMLPRQKARAIAAILQRDMV